VDVQDLDLSVRADNILDVADINTVGQLAEKTEFALLGLQRFGRTSLREVKVKLQQVGLHLGMAHNIVMAEYRPLLD